MDPETATKIDEMLTKLRDILNIEEGEEDDDGVGMDDDEEKRPLRETEEGKAERDEKPWKPFTMTIDDPSGNSFFQFVGSASDSQWNMRAYNRSFEQNVTLGLVARPDDMPDRESGPGQREVIKSVDQEHKLSNAEEFERRRKAVLDAAIAAGGIAPGVVPDEVFSFPSTCSSCGHELETLMQQVNIPYFQVSYSIRYAT
jgi:zinc finger protein